MAYAQGAFVETDHTTRLLGEMLRVEVKISFGGKGVYLLNIVRNVEASEGGRTGRSWRKGWTWAFVSTPEPWLIQDDVRSNRHCKRRNSIDAMYKTHFLFFLDETAKPPSPSPLSLETETLEIAADDKCPGRHPASTSTDLEAGRPGPDSC